MQKNDWQTGETWRDQGLTLFLCISSLHISYSLLNEPVIFKRMLLLFSSLHFTGHILLYSFNFNFQIFYKKNAEVKLQICNSNKSLYKVDHTVKPFILQLMKLMFCFSNREVPFPLKIIIILLLMMCKKFCIIRFQGASSQGKNLIAGRIDKMNVGSLSEGLLTTWSPYSEVFSSPCQVQPASC